jgi:outer membrane protein assembly factor BamB
MSLSAIRVSKRMRRVTIGGTLLMATALITLLLGSASVPRAAADTPSGGWPMFGFNLAKTNFNPLETTISPTTAPSLKLDWTYQSSRLIFDQPIQADGLIFWGALNGLEYATNPSTGDVVWSTSVGQLKLPSSCSSSVPNPLGVTGTSQFVQMTIHGVNTPVLIVSGGNSTVYALNASTGAIIWQTPVGDSPWDYIWDSPAVWKGYVYVGVASPANCPKTVDGQVFKLDARTGTLLKTFDVVPAGCVGGGVWGSIAIDTTADTLYVGTGNPDPHNCPTTAKPLAPAVLELSATNLSLIGDWQLPLAQQVKDSDFGSTPVLYSSSTGTPMIAISNKNGYLYAFNRGDLTAGPVWKFQVEDDSEPQLAPTSYNGHYLYVAGGENTVNGDQCKGSFYELNPDTGADVWGTCIPSWPLGAVAMGGGVAVIGTGKSFEVYASSTGKLLYTYTDKTSGSSFTGSATIADGQIVYGNQDGKLVAVGPG